MMSKRSLLHSPPQRLSVQRRALRSSSMRDRAQALATLSICVVVVALLHVKGSSGREK